MHDTLQSNIESLKTLRIHPLPDTQSPRMAERFSEIASDLVETRVLRLTETNDWILFEGEAGVGKHYYAQMLHSKSPHTRSGDFVEIDPSMSDEELKAILFNEGRKRSEGVLGRRIPLLDARSTLFVNHIEDFSLMNQTRIARFLIQHGPGDVKEKRARVVVSSCMPKSELMNSRRIVDSIQDILDGFHHIIIPPLRERREEIPGIASGILKRISNGRTRARLVIRPELVQQLVQYQWRDNMIELTALLEEAARKSRNGIVTLPEKFFDEVETVQDGIKALQATKGIRLEDLLSSVEKALVRRTLARYKNNLSKAARLLGLTDQNLRYRVRKYGLYAPRLRKKK